MPEPTHPATCTCEGLGVTVGEHGGPTECPSPDESLGYQFLFSWGGVELHAEPPVATYEQVLERAREVQAENGTEHGYFYITLVRTTTGEVRALGGSFTNHEMEES